MLFVSLFLFMTTTAMGQTSPGCGTQATVDNIPQPTLTLPGAQTGTPLLREVVAASGATVTLGPQNRARIARSTRIMSTVLAYWNSDVRAEDIGNRLTADITADGVEIGLLVPLVSFLDVAYKSGRPDAAKFVNPAIAEINPSVARLLCQRLGLPVALPFDRSGSKDRYEFGVLDQNLGAELQKIGLSRSGAAKPDPMVRCMGR
jgi:hypothetical protein